MKALQLTTVLLFSCIFNAIIKEVASAKILAVAFISSKSHKITYELLLHELAKRGHEVTILSPYLSGKKIRNFREILTEDGDKLMANNDKIPNFFEAKETGKSVNPFTQFKIFEEFCRMTYDLPHVQQLLKESFDLVVIPAIFNECTAGFAYKFNAPIILISPVSASSWMVRWMGGSSLPSIVPNIFTGYFGKMNFMERTLNLIAEVALSTAQSYLYVPAMESAYRDGLNDQSIPSSFEIFSNASLLLSNGHFSIGSPKPFFPDIIEVAGMHCRPAQPLPKDLEDFISGVGEDGFIYFSMGSAIVGSQLPETKRKMFLSVFSKLKQRVLWKWETEKMDDLPKNVKLSKWLPQQDLLGHPKLKAFITHGGFGSTTESVYHAAPLIGFPMFADQELNMKLGERQGFAISLDFVKFTEDELLNTIKKIIYDKTYKNNAEALSKIFRDQPDPPLQRAVFWTEYVLRHNGALHLRSSARDLNLFQYYLLDSIAFLLVILYIVIKIPIYICKRVCCKKSQGKPTNKTKKFN